MEKLTDRGRNGKEKPWTRNKILSEKVSGLYKKISEKYKNSAFDKSEYYKKRSDTMTDCASQLTFKSCKCGATKKLFKAHFCKLRLCQMCSWRKSLLTFHQTKTICHKIEEKTPGLNYLFLTLTMKNCKEEYLTECLKSLSKGFDNLLRHKRIIRTIQGAFRAIDITYNPLTKEYNPHLHCILCMGADYLKKNYIPKEIWVSQWRTALKVDYQPSINIQLIKQKNNSISTDIEELSNSGKGIEGAIAETSKYSVSIGNLFKDKDKKDNTEKAKARSTFAKNETEMSRVIEILDGALRNRKMTAYSGIFRKIFRKEKMKSVEESSLINISNENCNCAICNSTMSQQHAVWHKTKKDFFFV